MSDTTVYAERLIAAVARAFYEDDAVCLIDVLLRDKFLRDDDMGPRLSLPAKQLRKTMQLLQDEHLVKTELVDDLSSGGSQATKFWYVDYNHAVNVIRLRIYLIKKKLEEAELRARSSSMYLCPGYRTKDCNGRYTETEAQQVVDQDTGLFLCQECCQTHMNNPDPPPSSTYTLTLVDNTKDLKASMDNARRLKSQLSAKMSGNKQLRVGIYDLLQKVRESKGPLSSNLPSENRALGIGSKRLAGTGRTAGIKAKKLEKMGAGRKMDGPTRSEEGSELNFLKNARGEEIIFVIEKGGGTKANQLALGKRKNGLLEVAALKFSQKIGDEDVLARERKRAKAEHQKKKAAQPKELHFLTNNIGLMVQQEQETRENEENDSDSDSELGAMEDSFGVQIQMTEEERQSTFEKQFAKEMQRQKALFNILPADNHAAIVSEDNGHDDDDEACVGWEEG